MNSADCNDMNWPLGDILPRMASDNLKVSSLLCLLRSVETYGISRDDALSLESIDVDVLPEHCPVASYTLLRSNTNLEVTVESILGKIKDTIVGVFVYLYEAIIAVIKRIIAFITGKTSDISTRAAKITKANVNSVNKATIKLDVNKYNQMQKSYVVKYMEQNYRVMADNDKVYAYFEDLVGVMTAIMDTVDTAVKNFTMIASDGFDPDALSRLTAVTHLEASKDLRILWVGNFTNNLYMNMALWFEQSDISKTIPSKFIDTKDDSPLISNDEPYSLSVLLRRQKMISAMRLAKTESNLTEKELHDIAAHGLDVGTYAPTVGKVADLFKELIKRVESNKKVILDIQALVSNHRSVPLDAFRQLMFKISRYISLFTKYQEVAIQLFSAVTGEKISLLKAYNDSLIVL